MTPSEYRERQLANLSTNYEPPHLNTTTTYRKLKEEAVNDLLGYSQYKKQSITNSHFLNYCNVKKLDLEPFNIYYWSERQVEFWNSIQHKRLPLSFDATGSLVKKYSFYKDLDKSKLDVAHLLNTVRHWDCFDKIDPSIIDFYLRSVGYLTQVETLESFLDIVESTYEQQLNKFNADASFLESDEINENNKKKESKKGADNSLILFINNLFGKVVELCPQKFTKPFKTLCYTFPSWTYVMRNLFESPNIVATSTRSETFFKWRKAVITNPIIAQKFLLKEKTKTDGLINFGFTKLTSTDISKKKSIFNEVYELDIDLEKLQISNEINIGENSENMLMLQKSPVDDGLEFHSTQITNDIEEINYFRDQNMLQVSDTIDDDLETYELPIL
ncbi:hypothetical protein TSAR_008258 [Trichomalopsis sarcophagae]|uniref:Uncharacterized protein n=1 Tax=Trichomalopsis sarcophagae TaxID=543379 RepID=A0A232ET90_9HYME|nr:hypothetical protein TSAR_008258 [Trichomalopsis sarcophagae]